MPSAPSIQISRRSDQDRSALEAMYVDIFGQSAADDSRARWKWQYDDNPHCPSEGPEIWVAREDDRILGQYATMPVRLKVLDRTLAASWGMDVMVAPDQQRRGIGSRLFLYWDKQVEASLGLGLSVSSYTLFKKLNWEDVGPIPCFSSIVDPRPLVERRFGAAGAALAAPLIRLAQWLFLPRRRTRSGGAITIRELPADRALGEDYDRLWQRVAPQFDFITERTADYLQWKFRQVPYVSYDLYEARDAGTDTLEGYIVLRQTERNGIRLGLIVDILCDPEDKTTFGALLDRAFSWASEQRVARLQTFTLDRRIAARLASKGFLRIHSPMQFCLRLNTDHVDELFFRDTSRWHVSFGDSDQDRDV